MKNTNLLTAIAVAIFLSGCAAQVVSSSARTVVVRGPSKAYAESQKLADSECKKHDRFARLVDRPSPTNNSFIFDCVQ